MPKENEDVELEESSASEQEQASEETAEETAAASPEQETTEDSQEQSQTQKQGDASKTAGDALDEFGIPWKNRAMEWQRKFHETTESIPKMVEEALSKNQPKQHQYTIAQLEQYAIENPEYRPWVEEEKAKIIQSNVAKLAEDRFKEVEVKQKADSVRQQSWQWATNHPRLQECFATNPMGQKAWNPQHPLTQMISVYMQEPDLKARPDALMLASKLALADYLDFQNSQNQGKTKKLQQSLKKVQKQTFVEGSGTKPVAGKTSFQKARERLAQTGSKQDAKLAVSEYLRSIGAISE